jgi:predicted GNAT family acetyltransferase
MDYEVINNEQEQQFEILSMGEKATLSYRMYKGDIAFMHTLVPKDLEGKGLASALAKGAFAYAEKHNLPVMVYCPFVSVFVQRHPEYKKFIDPKYVGPAAPRPSDT